MSEEKVMDIQKEFVRTGGTLSKNYRITQLKKLKKIILDNQSDIIECLHKDLRKSSMEAFLTEVSSTIKEIDHAIESLGGWMLEKKWWSPLFLFPAKSKIMKEPLGSALIISPWNYPFHLAFAPVIAALSAGNSAVIKPSEIASHTEELLEKLINNNFQEKTLKVFTGGKELSENLTSLPFDFIFFTGSTAIGKKVMRAASANLTPVCLELGGKSPCVVDSEADLKVAARRIVWGKFTNAGQTCVAPDFLFVHRDSKEELIRNIQVEIENFYGEDPSQSKDYGRIINQEHFERLIGYLDGARLTYGGKYDSKTRYISPTLIDEPSWESSIMKEEVFGPLLPILVFENYDKLLMDLQKMEKPLAFYLFTKNKKVKDKFTNQLSFGGGCVNDTLVHLSDVNLPFGGVGSSGMGSYHGQAGFDLFSHSKSVVDKSFLLDFPLRYPPYSSNKQSLFKKLLKLL